jgi:NhaA family Na+:H+ antiporter
LARVIAQPLRAFLEIEASGGILLLAATVVALVWANSPWSHGYEAVWSAQLRLSVGSWHFDETLGLLVNDGLMAVFFFVIGLEIKREWVTGELRDRRAALLPVVAALGGMVVPALIYVAFTSGTAGGHGWGIPMATDIAFALGVVALLGTRVPSPLKVFLLTLAIVDDIGAIVVIAVFYGTHLSWTWLAVAVGLLAVVAVLGRSRVRWLPVYVLLGVVTWYATYRSGVHATMAGVALGLLTPAAPFQPEAVAAGVGERLRAGPVPSAVALQRMGRLARESVSVLDRIETTLHPWTSYLIVPAFALANAGVPLGDGVHGEGLAVALGVGVGLVVGKTVGVAGAAWLVIRAGLARLPTGVRWTQVLGVAMLAGIGFTVSLFVTSLAFAPGTAGMHLASHAKVGILGASFVAAVSGSALLAATARAGAARAGRR